MRKSEYTGLFLHVNVGGSPGNTHIRRLLSGVSIARRFCLGGGSTNILKPAQKILAKVRPEITGPPVIWKSTRVEAFHEEGGQQRIALRKLGKISSIENDMFGSVIRQRQNPPRGLLGALKRNKDYRTQVLAEKGGSTSAGRQPRFRPAKAFAKKRCQWLAAEGPAREGKEVAIGKRWCGPTIMAT